MVNKHSEPPRWPLFILERILSDRQLEVLYGDVMELYDDRIQYMSASRAKWLFIRDAFSLIRPFAIRTLFTEQKANSWAMFANYIKLAVRSAKRNKTSSLINIVGLVFGFFAAITISMYVFHELTYDRFHFSYQNIYRVSFQRWVNNDLEFNGATTFSPVGPAMIDVYPEVKQQCRLYYPFAPGIASRENNSFHIEKPIFVDDSYFRLFSAGLKAGNPSTALRDPNSVVLSESLAYQYFGTEDPIGKVLTFSFEDGKTDLVVTGIADNPRNDTHLDLEFLISMNTLDQWAIFKDIEWRLPFFHTYIFLEGADKEHFEMKASSLLDDHRMEMRSEGVKEFFKLQPIKDIHLDSDLTFEISQNGNRQAVNFMIIIAIMIMIIVYLNYVNLVTALNAKRSREVGVRKVMGSKRSQILTQFTVESICLNFLALIVALVLTFASFRYLTEWIGVDFSFVVDPVFLFLIVAITGIGALIFGFIPAIMISSVETITVLRGKLLSGVKGSGLRKVLVGLQFLITISMVGGLILLTDQTDYLLNRDPGFAVDQVLVINAPHIQYEENDYLRHVRRFGQEVTAFSMVNSFTHSGSVPGKVMSSGRIRRMGENQDEVTLSINAVDFDFFETYELEFLAGGPFSKIKQGNDVKLILNQAAMESLNFLTPKEAIGSKVFSRGQEFEVIGIVNNYHHTSLKSAYEPIAFVFSPARTLYLSINIQTDQLTETLQLLEDEMKRHFPSNPIEYFFLDRTFHEQFKSELSYIRIFRAFSILAVVIAIMGLYGLSTYVLSQHEKEIGIRKTLGAGYTHIFRFMGNFFFIPWMIGSVIALFLLVLGGTLWLETFPFRIDLPWTVLGIPLFLVVTLSLIIITIQSIKAWHVQPADVLKLE